MSSIVAELLLLLGIPALWLLDATVAWVGVLRHAYRSARAYGELAEIRRTGANGLLRWAAEHNLMGEWLRLSVKSGLLVFSVLRLSVTWERLETASRWWDWRDVALPLVLLAVLLLMTQWSNWEQQHRPIAH